MSRSWFAFSWWVFIAAVLSRMHFSNWKTLTFPHRWKAKETFPGKTIFWDRLGMCSCVNDKKSASLICFLFFLLTGVHSAKTHRLIRVLYDTRKQFSKKLNAIALPTQRSFEIPLTHGTRAAVQILFPPSWREELRDAAFPVLVEV